MAVKQQERKGGGERQTDSKEMEDKNIQLALDGDEDEDLPGPEKEQENPDNKEVHHELQENDEEEAQDET